MPAAPTADAAPSPPPSDLTIGRAWYHGECGTEGFAPRERGLGLDHSSLSAALSKTGTTAACVSFADGNNSSSNSRLQEGAEQHPL